ncbi:DHA2 family efflux MFS transporter permease subunit [Amycolatopsis oliviviridis]|nr:DHA2 family efflux MFS transporter permease subunit [Amycolatopsis oliviviridis]
MTNIVKPWAALSALCLGFFTIIMDTTIVPIAVPSMVRGLSASLNAIVWVISVYLLAYATLMLFTSRLGDRFGPRRVFLAGLTIFTLASLWCGMSGSIDTLIAARAVQGFGAALMTPQTLAFVGFLFPAARRGAAMGLWAAVAGLGTIAGPLLGGVLVQYLGWSWIFFVNVPIGVVTFLLTLRFVPDWRPERARSFDFAGILLSGTGLFFIVFGVQNGQKYDWGAVLGSISVSEIIGLGVVLLGAFVFWQRVNRKEPLVPLRVFRARNFSAGTIVWATVGFSMTGMILPLVIYFQSVLGLTPSMTGVLTAPMALLTGLMGPFVGRLSDRVSGRYLVLAGLGALASGLAVLALQMTPGTSPWALLPALLVCGMGFGLILAPVSNLAMGSVEPQLMGAASGIFNTGRQVGGVLGSAAVGVLMQARITASLTTEANAAAEGLPGQYRQSFIQTATKAAASAGEFVSGEGAPVVPGLPSELTARATELFSQSIHFGLTDAARQTLLLPAAVLLLGMVAAVTVRRTVPVVPASR